MFYNGLWKFAKLPCCNFTYGNLICVAIISIIACDSTKSIYNWYKNEKSRRITGFKSYFSNDIVKNLDENAIRRKYAQTIVLQLMGVDLSNEPFALAVTGEWGSGKTTFIKSMMHCEELKQQAYTLCFNPWDCSSPNAINKEFFIMLRNLVSEIYSPLGKSLLAYMNILYDLDISSSAKDLLKLLPLSNDDSLSNLKREITEGLRHIDKPIVVFIDDIDRLEKEELFEVLRLVRNTASFCNIIFIATFDEKYVTLQLKEKGIYDGKLFLEKIFTLQIALPKNDNVEIFDEFQRDLRGMVKATKYAKSCLDSLSQNEKESIKNALYTFRKAHRFARQLSASANFMYENLGEKGFLLHDLLFVELIRYLSPAFYDELTNTPDRYLAKHYSSDKNRIYYCVTEGREKDLNNAENMDLHDVTFRIFTDLFKDESPKNENSIRWSDRYDNYMCFGITQDKVSKLEFNIMINSQKEAYITNGMAATIRKWCKSNKGKKISSIYDQFASYKLNTKLETDVEQYIYALFYWLEYTDKNYEIYGMYLLKELFDKSKYDEKAQEAVLKLTIEKMRHIIKVDETNRKVAVLCSGLYESAQNNKLILSKKDIELMLNDNFSQLLKAQRWDAINLITVDGNKLNKVFKASVVSWSENEGKVRRRNIVIELVFKYFEKNKSHHTQEIKELLYTMDKGYPMHTDNNEIIKVKDLRELLGDNYAYNLKRFMTECFEEYNG